MAGMLVRSLRRYDGERVAAALRFLAAAEAGDIGVLGERVQGRVERKPGVCLWCRRPRGTVYQDRWILVPNETGRSERTWSETLLLLTYTLVQVALVVWVLGTREQGSGMLGRSWL